MISYYMNKFWMDLLYKEKLAIKSKSLPNVWELDFYGLVVDRELQQ